MNDVKLIYVNKDDEIREEVVHDEQTLNDLTEILERNGANYVIDDIGVTGEIRIPA